jgi:MoxR-like ATPase
MTETVPNNPSTDVSPEGIADKLNAVFERLNRGLIERDTEIRLAVLGALSGEHLLLIGPPGTAKSEIARRLVRAIGGDEIFERLLTRFSVPEELFGPLSLKALEDDRYERNTAKYLPTARVAFIDEIFKANSAILNSLLTILNERQFDNGTERVDVPLATLVGASNELPEGEELQALYDRFLLRRQVLPVSDEGFLEMLALDEDDDEESEAVVLSPELIEHVQLVAPAVAVSREVVEFIGVMRKLLAKEDIYVSDRRWVKSRILCKSPSAGVTRLHHSAAASAN